jgi:hypothetical protein
MEDQVTLNVINLCYVYMYVNMQTFFLKKYKGRLIKWKKHAGDPYISKHVYAWEQFSSVPPNP